MKKLMIAAASVCVAVMSQASTISWQTMNVYNGAVDKTQKASGVYYVFNSLDVNAATLISALEGAGASAIETYLGKIDTKIKGSSPSAGSYSDTSKTVAESSLGYSNETTGNSMTILLFNTDKITDSSYFMALDKGDVSIPKSGNGSFVFGSLGNTKGYDGVSQIAGNWHAVNVPEPTSGLLLLLGVAGMALRRRRA